MPEDLLIIDTKDPEVLWILGMPAFACAPIAHVLQRAGYDIPRKCEPEQAAVHIYLLRKYLDHGPDWRAKADEELNALAKKHPRPALDKNAILSVLRAGGELARKLQSFGLKLVKEEKCQFQPDLDAAPSATTAKASAAA